MFCGKCGSWNIGTGGDNDGWEKEEIWKCFDCNKMLKPEDINYEDE